MGQQRASRGTVTPLSTAAGPASPNFWDLPDVRIQYEKRHPDFAQG